MSNNVTKDVEENVTCGNDGNIDPQLTTEASNDHCHTPVPCSILVFDETKQEQESPANTKCESPCCSCTSSSNAECVTEYFQDEICSSNKLLEESNQWLNSLHSVEKHHKENIMLSPIDCTEKCMFFDHVIQEFQNDSDEHNIKDCCDISHGTHSMRLLERDLILLDIEDDFEEQPIENNKSTITPLYFNCLPDEVKLHVFSYFTRRELCRYVAPVCLTWFHLAKDSMFWMSIYNEDFIDVDNDLMVDVILAWCANLTYLELDERSEILNSDFERIFESCVHIQYLSLKLCKQINDETLRCIAMHCKGLKGIDLEGCTNVTDKSFYHLIGLPLQSVGVAYCYSVSDEGGIFLARNFRHLRHVNFEGIQWMTNYFVEVLVAQHHATLEEIQLDGDNLTNASINELIKCKRLRVLELSFCESLTTRSIDLVARCSTINVLKLRKGLEFKHDSLLRYFVGMSSEQGMKFKSLNLSECSELSDECLFHLAEKCPNLEYLNLSWCWEVSDDGIAFVIDTCHKLKELHLIGLHELYGIPFSRIQRNNPNLTNLDLSQCNKINDDIISMLVRNMPKLKATNYYGDSVS